jgi:NOL1/NOP2/sun family putative RNA methylase
MESVTWFEAYREIIPDFPGFQEGLRRKLPTHIRINGLKTEPEEVRLALEEKGIELRQVMDGEPTLYHAPDLENPGNLLEYFLGYIHPQALTSCLASKVLGPRPGSFVLDMCASPGGKTSHMAQLMKNTGLVVANELYASRRIPLGHTLGRMGVMNSVMTPYQAQQFPLGRQFDYVLADVPCTGEGQFRALTRSATHREGRGRHTLPDLQRTIIMRGFELLRKGGEMLYSTCTYNPEENESVVNHLLGRRDARLLSIDAGVGHEPGLSSWKGEIYDRQIRLAARFYPHRVDSVGFFMARILRNG